MANRLTSELESTGPVGQTINWRTTYSSFPATINVDRGLEHGGRGFGCSASHRFYGENFAPLVQYFQVRSLDG